MACDYMSGFDSMEMLAVSHRLEQSFEFYVSMPAENRAWRDEVGNTKFPV